MVTGATGYVGGRLVPRLLDAGHQVTVLVRSPHKIAETPWARHVSIIEGDLQSAQDVNAAAQGIDVIYALVHAMSAGGDFESSEGAMARNIADAAQAHGVRRLVYLGGLHPQGADLSDHLRSRLAVGEIFLESATPTIVLQAGVIIGSGSASFEMIRHLTEVLPVMPAPKWVNNRVQPIAIRDALHYLVKAAEITGDVNRAFDIGGPDALAYKDVMQGYAKVSGLHRRGIVALPVLTPWLAAQWVNLVTPIPRKLAIPLVGSLQHDCVVSERDIDAYIPPPSAGLVSYQDAVRLALRKVDDGEVETSWQDASVHGAPSDPLPTDPDWAGYRVYTDVKYGRTQAPPERVWDVVESIGGKTGWYSMHILWSARGLIDKLVGGVGLQRGRRNPHRLRTGDAIDFWRVEALERGSKLVLRAEMRMPGEAWLELEVRVHPEGGSILRQRAIFFPRGLPGRLYWWSVLPFHGFIFGAMTRQIIEIAEESSSAQGRHRA